MDAKEREVINFIESFETQIEIVYFTLKFSKLLLCKLKIISNDEGVICLSKKFLCVQTLVDCLELKR